MLDGGVVVEERAGAGRRLVVLDASTLETFYRQRFPKTNVAPVVASRVSGVARFRNSKTFTNDTPEIISVRAWRMGALLRNTVDAGAVGATVTDRLFSFSLQANTDYTIEGSCALVENPTVFNQFEHLGLDAGLVLYGHGRVSNRLIAWLVGLTTDYSLLHLPDYDPVGLSEFGRLRAQLGSRVKLYLPPDLESKFAQYSSRDLLKKGNNRAMLAKLRQSPWPEVLKVVAMIDRYNAGLEQEVLFLRSATA